jgi:hypothetical protein
MQQQGGCGGTCAMEQTRRMFAPHAGVAQLRVQVSLGLLVGRLDLTFEPGPRDETASLHVTLRDYDCRARAHEMVLPSSTRPLYIRLKPVFCLDNCT